MPVTLDSLKLQKILLLVFIVASSQSDAQKCGKNIDRDASCSNDSVYMSNVVHRKIYPQIIISLR